MNSFKLLLNYFVNFAVVSGLYARRAVRAATSSAAGGTTTPPTPTRWRRRRPPRETTSRRPSSSTTTGVAPVLRDDALPAPSERRRRRRMRTRRRSCSGRRRCPVRRPPAGIRTSIPSPNCSAAWNCVRRSIGSRRRPRRVTRTKVRSQKSETCCLF